MSAKSMVLGTMMVVETKRRRDAFVSRSRHIEIRSNMRAYLISVDNAIKSVTCSSQRSQSAFMPRSRASEMEAEGCLNLVLVEIAILLHDRSS